MESPSAPIISPPPPPHRPRVLLGLTGSVATVKWAALVCALAEFADVRVVCTRAARHFMAMSEAYDAEAWARMRAVVPPVPVLDDADEWRDYASVHRDSVLHIEVRAHGARVCGAALR